ncbi:hypothetical protein GCM10009528_39330 [Kineococcus aurantiacus]
MAAAAHGGGDPVADVAAELAQVRGEAVADLHAPEVLPALHPPQVRGGDETVRARGAVPGVRQQRGDPPLEPLVVEVRGAAVGLVGVPPRGGGRGPQGGGDRQPRDDELGPQLSPRSATDPGG